VSSFKPWQVSALLHSIPMAVLALVFILESLSLPRAIPDKIVSFEMIKAPPKPQPVNEIQTSTKPKAQPKPKGPLKRVFGARRDSVTSKDKDGASVKVGNTLLKEDEGKTLEDEDPTSLPVPEKEFLITQMPSVLKKTKIRYPPKAREMGLEGSVVFNLLIDEQGKVRKAELLEGLIDEMDREAKRAVMGYVFSPAFVEGKPVASKIRFSVRFILEES